MKLITILSISLIITLPAAAQIKKGQFLVGGNISFESIKGEGNNAVTHKTTNFFISPNVGYFIVEKLAGGLRVSSTSYKQEIPIDLRVKSFTISPFVRYYFLPATRNVNAFIDLGFLISKTKNKYTSGATTSSYSEKSNGYSISAGPTIFLNDHVSIEFTVGYKSITGDNLYKNKSSTINSALGLQIHLGKIKTKAK